MSNFTTLLITNAVPLLLAIRKNLAYDTTAGYIAPNEMIDDFVERNLLRQSQFEDTAGGNILDPNHLGDFIKLISVGKDGDAPWNRKAAAILFFRQHIISIVKYPVGPEQVSYDLVDSLPRGESQRHATRTVCRDVDSLLVLLRRYTTKQFTEENCAHIDRNSFSAYASTGAGDTTDPRAFQGFAWSDKPAVFPFL
jgi:hypothetical protein